jgi:hypothetical protein
MRRTWRACARRLADQRQPWPGGGQRRLRELLLDREDLHAVLDVWEGEPQVDLQLADLCTLATPHIAGYSLDGKPARHGADLPGVLPLPRVNEQVQLADLLPRPPLAQIELDAGADPAWALATLCRAVYDPRRDDADFRRSLSDDPQQRAAFDQLRKQYPAGARSRAGGALRGEAPQLAQVVKCLGCGAGLIGQIKTRRRRRVARIRRSTFAYALDPAFFQALQACWIICSVIGTSRPGVDDRTAHLRLRGLGLLVVAAVLQAHGLSPLQVQAQVPFAVTGL